MIKYEWRTELSADETEELADLLSRAAQYDAEPEYTTIKMSDVLESMAHGGTATHHLLIWMLPYATQLSEQEGPEQIAGLLRLVMGRRGIAEAALVIDPRFRSIGITTLLLERVGLDLTATDGWLGTGAHHITSWAQGNHPAAGRLGDRFLIPRTKRIWKLIQSAVPLRTDAAPGVVETISAADVAELDWAAGMTASSAYALRHNNQIAGLVTLDLDPVQSDEFGRCATITGYRVSDEAPVGIRRALLGAAVDIVHREELSGVIIYVDSADRDWVNACRLSGFQHDRTDVQYHIGDNPSR